MIELIIPFYYEDPTEHESKQLENNARVLETLTKDNSVKRSLLLHATGDSPGVKDEVLVMPATRDIVNLFLDLGILEKEDGKALNTALMAHTPPQFGPGPRW